MSKTRPGLERIERQELRAMVAEHAMALKTHQHVCNICHQAGADVHAMCEVWWNHARKLHKARRRLHYFEHPPVTSQLALPGME